MCSDENLASGLFFIFFSFFLFRVLSVLRINIPLKRTPSPLCLLTLSLNRELARLRGQTRGNRQELSARTRKIQALTQREPRDDARTRMKENNFDKKTKIINMADQMDKIDKTRQCQYFRLKNVQTRLEKDANKSMNSNGFRAVEAIARARDLQTSLDKNIRRR